MVRMSHTHNWVVGMGVNIHAAPKQTLRYPATSLREGGVNLTAQAVLVEFGKQLKVMLPKFVDSGFKPFHKPYLDADVVAGQQLDLEGGMVTVQSIDNTGALVVNQDGMLKRYVSGELSLPWPSY